MGFLNCSNSNELRSDINIMSDLFDKIQAVCSKLLSLISFKTSQAEEATEARESPSALVEVLENAHESVDETADAEVAQLLDQSPVIIKSDTQFQVSAAIYALNELTHRQGRLQVVNESSPAQVLGKDPQRFSVTSYMTNMNRMRFHSECPPFEENFHDNDSSELVTPNPNELAPRNDLFEFIDADL
jgi:hypothetical protein